MESTLTFANGKNKKLHIFHMLAVAATVSLLAVNMSAFFNTKAHATHISAAQKVSTPMLTVPTSKPAASRETDVEKSEQIKKMEEENLQILNKLNQVEKEIPLLEAEAQEAKKLLEESQALIPELENEVNEAKRAAIDAQELYLVRENATIITKGEVEVLQKEVLEASQETEKLQGFVSNVARDMYINGGSETPNEFEVVFSENDPASVITQMQNTETFANKAGEKINTQVTKQTELDKKLVQLENKKLEIEQEEVSAQAQKQLAEENLRIAVEKDAKLKEVILKRSALVTEIETRINEKEIEASDLSSFAMTLTEERESLKTWLSVNTTLAVTEAASTACPKVTPAGSNWDNVNMYDVCVKAVSEAPTPEAQKAILYAFNHLGATYSQGNRYSTDPPVFDCSSFVARAYNAGGAYIKKNNKVYNWMNMFGSTVRYTENVYEGTNLKRVNVGDGLKPGDVFIQFNGPNPSNSGGDAGHAQMYLGFHEGKHLIIQSGGGRDSKTNVSEHVNSFSNEWVFRYARS